MSKKKTGTQSLSRLDQAEIILAGGCNECFSRTGHTSTCSKAWGMWTHGVLGITRGGVAPSNINIIHSGRRQGKSMLSNQSVQRAIREGKKVGVINYE